MAGGFFCPCSGKVNSPISFPNFNRDTLKTMKISVTWKRSIKHRPIKLPTINYNYYSISNQFKIDWTRLKNHLEAKRIFQVEDSKALKRVSIASIDFFCLLRDFVNSFLQGLIFIKKTYIKLFRFQQKLFKPEKSHGPTIVKCSKERQHINQKIFLKFSRLSNFL